MKRFLSWRKYHKWFGVLLSVFMLVFCVSGIILNHRQLFAKCNVSRDLLPHGYHIEQYNNGILKGTVPLGGDSVLAYGCAGVWLTQKDGEHWQSFNAGLPQGADQRNVRNVVKTKRGDLWCVTPYELYRLDGRTWKSVSLPTEGERLADVTLTKDSLQVLALSRSAVYFVHGQKAAWHVERKSLSSPDGYHPEETLFRLVWKLHSGELFGLAGRLVVDAIAVVLICLSLTGIWIFLLPYSIRRHKRKGDKQACKQNVKRMAWNVRWHNRLGKSTIVLTLLLTLTGTCLRPPLMIPLVLAKTSLLQSHDNVWHDKLRAIRWDREKKEWLLSTTEGFLRIDEHFMGKPTLLPKENTPKVSPMGINVFCQQADGTWLVGSFSGMYRWMPNRGEVRDYFTGKMPDKKHGMPIASSLVTGYSGDFCLRGGGAVVFDYSKGAERMPEMPQMLSDVPMSLWNVALELHVGRCYVPFLGPLSELFVFLFGTLLTLIVLSGYIVYRRHRA